MDNLKDLWEKHKKIILILLLLLFLLLPLIFTKGFGLFKSDELSSKIGKYNLEEMDDLDTPDIFSEGNFIKTFGKVSSLQGEDFFTLKTESRSFYVYLYDLEDYSRKISIDGVSDNDYVAVEGKWNESYNAIIAEKVVKLDNKKVEDYLSAKIPMLEIEVVDYPRSVPHSCETLKFALMLTNVGKTPIVREEMFKLEGEKGSLHGYGFFHILDDLNPQLAENYDETDGILKVWGVKEFDVINPGESVDVEYYAGGLVTESLYRDMFEDDGSNRRAGVGGEQNILGNKGQGEHSVSFAWGQFIYTTEDGWIQESYIDPKILFKTDPVTINLVEDKCDMSNPTNIFWVEPL
jgi:hypothetical protein